MNNQVKENDTAKTVNLFLAIIILIMVITGSTFAYFAFSTSNNIITGTAGEVELTLTVTKVLPDGDDVADNILITNFSELDDNLNAMCTDGTYALCQLYRINLANASTGVNTNVKGSLSFNNATVPNLSWVYLGNSYSADTQYTGAMLGGLTINTASSTFTNFINNHLLTSGNNIDFYILVWVNESAEEQTDNGQYSGIVRFEDSNGKGVTSTFTSN